MPSAQHQHTADAVNGIPAGKAAQPAASGMPRPAKQLEPFHVAACLSVAAELKARAFELRETTRPMAWRESTGYSERAALWDDLAARINARIRGSRITAFDYKDVELVRYYRLVQLHRVTDNREVKKQRTQQLDSLFYALYDALVPLQRAKVDRDLLPAQVTR